MTDYTIYNQNGIKIYWQRERSQFVAEFNGGLKKRMQMKNSFEEYDDKFKQEIIDEFLLAIERNPNQGYQ